MLKVSDSVYRLFAGVTANQYLIVEPQGLTLVDAGLPGSEALIFARIRDIGRYPEDLQRILITHSDPDHTGAAKALRAGSGGKLCAGAVAAEGLRQGRMTRPIASRTLEGKFFNLVIPLFRVQPVEVDEILKPGQELPVLGGLRVLATPGHTPGHMSFYAPGPRILFSGDAIQIVGDDISAYLGDSTWDKPLARRSFEEQLALEPEIICGGHGFWPKWY